MPPDCASSSSSRQWRWDDYFAYDLSHVAETIDLDPVVQSTYGMRLVPKHPIPGGEVAVAMAFLQSVEDSQSSEHRDRILDYLRESPMFSHLVKNEDSASLRDNDEDTLSSSYDDGSSYDPPPSLYSAISALSLYAPESPVMPESPPPLVPTRSPPRGRGGVADKLAYFARGRVRDVLGRTPKLPGPRQRLLTESPFQADLPPRAVCYGRGHSRQALVRALDPEASGSKAVVILGGPGMGKTVLANSVIYSDEVNLHYALKIWIELDGCRSPYDLDRATCTALHLDPHCTLTACIKRLERLAKDFGSTSLVVLDGLESVWDASATRRAVEDRLDQIRAVASLVVTVRGLIVPTLSPTSWDQSCRLDVLDPTAAKKLFLLEAPPEAATDPRLDDMLTICGRQPLALKLLSLHAREGEPLSRLVDLWRKERSRLFETGAGVHKDESLAVSVNLALVSERVRAHWFVWSFVRLLAAFPEGMDERQLASFFVFHSGNGSLSFGSRDRLLAELHALGLVQRHHRRRAWRFLPPLRQYIYDRFACPSEAYAARYNRATVNPKIEGLFGVRVSDQHQAKLVPDLTALVLRLDLFGHPGRQTRFRSHVQPAVNRDRASAEGRPTEATILWAGLSGGETFQAGHVSWSDLWTGEGPFFKELVGLLTWGQTKPLTEDDILTDTRQRRDEDWEAWKSNWVLSPGASSPRSTQTTPWLGHPKEILTMLVVLVQHTVPFRVGVAGSVGQSESAAWNMLLPGIYA